jgi:hypothetical protein
MKIKGSNENEERGLVLMRHRGLVLMRHTRPRKTPAALLASRRMNRGGQRRMKREAEAARGPDGSHISAPALTAGMRHSRRKTLLFIRLSLALHSALPPSSFCCASGGGVCGRSALHASCSALHACSPHLATAPSACSPLHATPPSTYIARLSR